MVLDPNAETAWEGNYEWTADLFRKLNYFNFTTIQQWSVFIGFIFSFILIILLKNSYVENSHEKLFLWCSIGLLNIYVFTIGKDIVQYVIFLFVYIVARTNLKSKTKVFLIALIFYYESTFFRSYYIIMAGLVIAIFYIIKDVTKRRIIISFFAIFVLMFTTVYVSKYFYPDDYNDLLHIRQSYYALPSKTMINNLIDGYDSFYVFILNYFINLTRLIIPIELLFKGIGYIPFLFFMYLLIYFLIILFRNSSTLKLNDIVNLSSLLAYVLVSALFEPDFGSWSRHLSAAMPLIYLVVFRNSNTSSISIESEINTQ